MIYVFPGGNIVFDGSTISEEQKAQAVVVKELPKPETPKGKYAQIKADKKTETIYYEYYDIPEDPGIEKLKQIVADLSERVFLGKNLPEHEENAEQFLKDIGRLEDEKPPVPDKE